jgi:hypothetical protein
MIDILWNEEPHNIPKGIQSQPTACSPAKGSGSGHTDLEELAQKKKKRSVSRLAVSFLGHQIKDFSAFPTHFTLHARLPIKQAIRSKSPGYKEPFHA